MSESIANNTGLRIGCKIAELVGLIDTYPFVGMLLRTFIVNPDAEDVDIFQKTLRTYQDKIIDMDKNDIEESFTIFSHIPNIDRNQYLSLYNILNKGYK